jgi:hypothetical protein
MMKIAFNDKRLMVNEKIERKDGGHKLDKNQRSHLGTVGYEIGCSTRRFEEEEEEDEGELRALNTKRQTKNSQKNKIPYKGYLRPYAAHRTL